MTKFTPILLTISLLFIFQSCGNYKLNYSKDVKDWESKQPDEQLQLKHRMYLVGDAGGAPMGESVPVLKYLKTQLHQEGKNSSIVFLGDNIYPDGMPAKSHEEERKLAEHRIDKQLEILEGYDGEIVFIPGNHDWYSGLKGLHRQEDYVEKALNEQRGITDEDDYKNYFLPDNGCSGPEVVEINDTNKEILY